MANSIWQHFAAAVLLASFLSWIASVVRLARGPRGAAKVAITVLVLGFVPLYSVSATGMVLSFSPSLSIAGTALWALILARRLGVEGLDRDITGTALLVFAVSVAVYVSQLGGIGPDLYESGYGFSFWDVVLAASAVAAFIKGSRLAWLLIACLSAHATGLLDTSNIFDTLVDGPAFLLSLSVLLVILVGSIKILPKRRVL